MPATLSKIKFKHDPVRKEVTQRAMMVAANALSHVLGKTIVDELTPFSCTLKGGQIVGRKMAGSLVSFKGMREGELVYGVISHDEPTKTNVKEPGTMMVNIFGHPEQVGPDPVCMSAAEFNDSAVGIVLSVVSTKGQAAPTLCEINGETVLLYMNENATIGNGGVTGITVKVVGKGAEFDKVMSVREAISKAGHDWRPVVHPDAIHNFKEELVQDPFNAHHLNNTELPAAEECLSSTFDLRQILSHEAVEMFIDCGFSREMDGSPVESFDTAASDNNEANVNCTTLRLAKFLRAIFGMSAEEEAMVNRLFNMQCTAKTGGYAGIIMRDFEAFMIAAGRFIDSLHPDILLIKMILSHPGVKDRVAHEGLSHSGNSMLGTALAIAAYVNEDFEVTRSDDPTVADEWSPGAPHTGPRHKRPYSSPPGLITSMAVSSSREWVAQMGCPWSAIKAPTRVGTCAACRAPKPDLSILIQTLTNSNALALKTLKEGWRERLYINE